MNANGKNRLTDSSYYYGIKTALFQRLFRAYATVFFSYSPWVGAWFALISWCSPRTAFAGFFSLLCTWGWGRVLSIKPPGDLHLVNGLLCGLFLSAFYPVTPQLLVGLLVVTLFVTICVNWFCNFLWNVGKVPLMSLPFVLGTWIMILIFHEKQLISFPSMIVSWKDLPDFLSWPWSNDFFSSMGGLLLVPYPLTGALVFLGICIASRYLALLAIAGYAIGALLLDFLGFGFLTVETGYNFMLVAIALGGIFMRPSLFSFFVALCGSALSAVFILSLYKLLSPLQLPMLVLPFLLSTYFWLGGLSYRTDKKQNTLSLDSPISPEIAHERYSLECARGIHIDSTYISQPFLDEWAVAYDSDIGLNYFTRPVQLTDSITDNGSDKIMAMEQPVFAPDDASVMEMRDIVSDDYQKAALDEKWGNFILLRDYLGTYILLPYLKAGSIKPRPGEWVTRGQPIGACDAINDSEYRLYIQIQKGVRPYSKHMPFHLSNVLTYKKNQPKQFNLFYVPVAGDYLISAQRNHDLAAALTLQPALTLEYAVTDQNKRKEIMMLQTGVTPQGLTRLYAARDRSVGYEETPLSMVFYDMQGDRDILLDLWVLAMGLTPLTSQTDCWYDEPPLKRWPLGFGKRMLVALLRPLGVACKSNYTRSWDEESKVWVQKGVHRAHIMPGVNWEANTSAIIDPGLGVVRIEFKFSGHTWMAELERSIAAGDKV